MESPVTGRHRSRKFRIFEVFGERPPFLVVGAAEHPERDEQALHHRGDGGVDVAKPLGHGKPSAGGTAAIRQGTGLRNRTARLDFGTGRRTHRPETGCGGGERPDPGLVSVNPRSIRSIGGEGIPTSRDRHPPRMPPAKLPGPPPSGRSGTAADASGDRGADWQRRACPPDRAASGGPGAHGDRDEPNCPVAVPPPAAVWEGKPERKDQKSPKEHCAA